MMSPTELFELETPVRGGKAFSPVPRPAQWHFECAVRQHGALQNATEAWAPCRASLEAQAEVSQGRRAAWQSAPQTT